MNLSYAQTLVYILKMGVEYFWKKAEFFGLFLCPFSEYMSHAIGSHMPCPPSKRPLKRCYFAKYFIYM